jgi:integrase
MFALGVQAGKIAQRPHIPAIQVSNTRTGFFEHTDFAPLLAELPDYLKPVVEFAYYTGWRIPSEVLRLTWAQVDFDAGVVRLEPRSTKNDEGRTFPFDALPAGGTATGTA